MRSSSRGRPPWRFRPRVRGSLRRVSAPLRLGDSQPPALNLRNQQVDELIDIAVPWPQLAQAIRQRRAGGITGPFGQPAARRSHCRAHHPCPERARFFPSIRNPLQPLFSGTAVLRDGVPLARSTAAMFIASVDRKPKLTALPGERPATSSNASTRAAISAPA